MFFFAWRKFCNILILLFPFSFSSDVLTGELYVQSLKMFDEKMYMQLLGIVDLAIKEAIENSENFETEYVSLFAHNLSLLLPFKYSVSKWLPASILCLFYWWFQGTCPPCTTSCFGDLALIGSSWAPFINVANPAKRVFALSSTGWFCFAKWGRWDWAEQHRSPCKQVLDVTLLLTSLNSDNRLSFHPRQWSIGT